MLWDFSENVFTFSYKNSPVESPTKCSYLTNGSIVVTITFSVSFKKFGVISEEWKEPHWNETSTENSLQWCVAVCYITALLSEGFQERAAEMSTLKQTGLEVTHCLLCLWHHQECCQLGSKSRFFITWWCKRQREQLAFQTLGRMCSPSNLSELSSLKNCVHWVWKSLQ